MAILLNCLNSPLANEIMAYHRMQRDLDIGHTSTRWVIVHALEKSWRVLWESHITRRTAAA